jgi:hypothetical protein
MLQLQIKLLSDATFSSGDGVAGQLDTEVEHDAHGFPLVRGRTLKGLLVEECANIMWSLQCQGARDLADYEAAAHFLFGSPGSRATTRARMHVGNAQFPAALRAGVAVDIQDRNNPLTATDVLNSLTATRRQSAVEEKSGAPDQGSLRSGRVLLRYSVLEADLTFDAPPGPTVQALLAACVLSLRRGGTSRNRGRGRLCCTLWDDGLQSEVTEAYLVPFLNRGGSA